MHLKKLFEDIRRCKQYPETRHIKWDFVFEIDDRNFLFAFLPTIVWQPSIYRYPNVCIIQIWWLNFNIGIGRWADKEEDE